MKFLGKKAFIIYAILAILALILLSPLAEIKISRFLANLTQQLIIEEINPVRESYGFSQVQPSKKLNLAAQMKAEDMVARNYFSHKGPNGEAPWVWLDQVDYDYTGAGENLAMDVNDPEVLKNAWLASSSHAKNILNSYFTDIGVGIAKGKINDKETIVVVMFLGREASPEQAPEPSIELSTIDVPPEEPVVTKTVEENKTDQEKIIARLENKPKPTNPISRFITFLLISLLRLLP